MRFERVRALVLVMVDDAGVECDRVAIGGRVGVGEGEGEGEGGGF